MNGDDGFVLVKGIAGMGNRILAFLSGLLYARLTGRRLVVDWCDGYYAPPDLNAFPLLFRSQTARPLDSLPPFPSVTPRIWQGHLRSTALEMRMAFEQGPLPSAAFAGQLFSFDIANLKHTEDVVVMWSLVSMVHLLKAHMTGPWSEWKSLNEHSILARLLHEDLEPHPEVSRQVHDIRRTWPDRPRIGVHVRHSDRRTNVGRVLRSLDDLVARHRDAVVFLATDSAWIEDVFRRRYSGLLTAPKWLPASGPLHRLDAECPDRLAMARASLVDMQLLAGCDFLIVNSDSSFSQIAKLWWLGDRRRAVDVASWAWLPERFRTAVWRTRESLRWGPRLWHIRRQMRRRRAVRGQGMPRWPQT